MRPNHYYTQQIKLIDSDYATCAKIGRKWGGAWEKYFPGVGCGCLRRPGALRGASILQILLVARETGRSFEICRRPYAIAGRDEALALEKSNSGRLKRIILSLSHRASEISAVS